MPVTNMCNIQIDPADKKRLRHFKEGMGVTYTEAIRYLLHSAQLVNETDFEHGIRVAEKEQRNRTEAKRDA